MSSMMTMLASHGSEDCQQHECSTSYFNAAVKMVPKCGDFVSAYYIHYKRIAMILMFVFIS